MSEALNDGGGKTLVFAFGDPEPVLSSTYLDYLGTFLDISGDYYHPPIDLNGLARLTRANAYHGSILHFKKNCIANDFMPSALLGAAELADAAFDWVVYNNMYFQKKYNGLGRVTRLVRLPAKDMRRGKTSDVYYRVNTNLETVTRNAIEYRPGEVIHIKGQDVAQSIYGVPEYIGGVQSVLLSEEATLFRRRYYLNGAHMGYILVTSDAGLDDKTAKVIENAVSGTKGLGNGKSIYINIPRTTNGQKEPVKAIPIGNLGTKDEYNGIKEVTEMEMLAMHRIQPGLACILPGNVGGFGDLNTQLETYYRLEVPSLRRPFLQINEMLGLEAVRFGDPDWKNQPTS